MGVQIQMSNLNIFNWIPAWFVHQLPFPLSASFTLFSSVFNFIKSATNFFAQMKFSQDIFIPKICYTRQDANTLWFVLHLVQLLLLRVQLPWIMTHVQSSNFLACDRQRVSSQLSLSLFVHLCRLHKKIILMSVYTVGLIFVEW